MSKSAKRLGRGLDSLVSNLRSGSVPAAPPVTETEAARQSALARPPATGDQRTNISIDLLDINPQQPRNTISEEDITHLSDSIRQHGVLQPIVARRADDRFQIIAGERRWRAARRAGMSEVPVSVRDATDEQMLELALIENIQREDLNAIDRARAYREFCDRFGLRPEEVAQRMGEDRSTVANYLRLLELPADIQAMVADQRVSMGHARCLLGVTDAARRSRLAESVAQNELSVRALEEIVRREKTQKEPGSDTVVSSSAPVRAHLRDLERRFEQAVGTKVAIREGKRKGTGRIVIQYYTLDDFDRVAERLGVKAE